MSKRARAASKHEHTTVEEVPSTHIIYTWHVRGSTYVHRGSTWTYADTHIREWRDACHITCRVAVHTYVDSVHPSHVMHRLTLPSPPRNPNPPPNSPHAHAKMRHVDLRSSNPTSVNVRNMCCTMCCRRRCWQYRRCYRYEHVM